ncbi:hypothetical protein ACSBR1_005664 [Camellia fascicularis]
MLCYDFATAQVQLVGVSMAWHNYIRRNTRNPANVQPIVTEADATNIINGIPLFAPPGGDGVIIGDDDPDMELVRNVIRHRLDHV